MKERICRNCGREYRGLVCHACHPRRVKRERANTVPTVQTLGGRAQSAGAVADAPPQVAAAGRDCAQYWLCACGEFVPLAVALCPSCGVWRPPQMTGAMVEAGGTA